MNKKELTETEIRTKFITPAIVDAGWDVMRQISEEKYFTDGKIFVRGQMVSKGKGKKADYLLYYEPNILLAVVEAKDNHHEIDGGLQQALGYAEILDTPFVFSSNGDGFAFHDRTGTFPGVETRLALDEFPAPAELWQKYREWKGLTPEAEKVTRESYYDDPSGKEPRYYQRNAINRTVEAIATGQDRILLVMATGTGKTYTAFQIIWRLWKSRTKKRILYLADRNILIDQTMVNDFRPFGEAMAKLSAKAKTISRDDGSEERIGGTIDRKHRRIDTAYEIYLGLYQSLTGPEESDKIYREFSEDFFDLIVIDECHRGSAAEDSVWREILDHFSAATHIGMTATPKETKYVSNIHYFGDPVYTYSLKQGIDDGFLAPYKVVKVHIDKDVEGYRPEKGKKDADGELIEDRLYNQKDFDRNIVLDDRTKLVAKKVSEYIRESGDPYQKTIVFCVDTEHALRMRKAFVDENEKLVQENSRYVMRITGDDKEGVDQLDNFIDPESRYPVIVTTSRLLSTGVDAQTCRLIVLEREVGSMTEFKQIIGRGTRIHKDEKKFYFTLIDFRKATNHFADPDFDGEPVQIYEPGEDDPIAPPDPEENEPPVVQDEEGNYTVDGQEVDEDEIEVIVDAPTGTDAGGDEEPKKKIYVNGVPVKVLSERVQYLDDNGKLVTESLRDYSRKAIHRQYASLDDFLTGWNTSERKKVLIEELENQGLVLEALQADVGKDLDAFDLICHVAFDQPPLTRQDRANNVKKRDFFTRYGEEARAILEALLDRYADRGLFEIEDREVLYQSPFSEIGTPIQIAGYFGGPDGYAEAITELERALYENAA
ncbi:MAG: DEAD/DEAH box helicase family protein [Verrucomicrobiales bacterium]